MIDTAALNRQWQDTAAKEIDVLLHHKYFDFKYPNFNPSK